METYVCIALLRSATKNGFVQSSWEEDHVVRANTVRCLSKCEASADGREGKTGQCLSLFPDVSICCEMVWRMETYVFIALLLYGDFCLLVNSKNGAQRNIRVFLISPQRSPICQYRRSFRSSPAIAGCRVFSPWFVVPFQAVPHWWG